MTPPSPLGRAQGPQGHLLRRTVALVLALGLLAPLSTRIAAGDERADAAGRAAGYLVDQQTPTGAFAEEDQRADNTGEWLMAVAAGGVGGEPVERALGYIRENGPGTAEEQPAFAGRIAMGVAAAGRDPRDLDGVDYVAHAESDYNPVTGSYDVPFFSNLLAVLGVLTAEEGLPEQAVDYLRTNQCTDGGYGWAEACAEGADTDSTALALNALLAAGLAPDDDTVADARTWLLDAQNADGGFAHLPGDETDANATGLALAAITALGEDPTADPWVQDDGNPVQALLGLQHPSGGLRWRAAEEEPNNTATVQALPGLAGHSLPVLPAPDGAEAEQTPPPGDTGSRTGPTPAPDPEPTPDSEREREVQRVEEPDPTPTPAPELEATDVTASARAGVVVRYDSGEEERVCVPFEEDTELTGEELLERAGLDTALERTQMGAAVCRIGPDGCEPGDCFCDYPTFWGYWTLDPGEEDWAFSEAGPAERRVVDGSVDGWSWGQDGEPPPEDTSIDEVCGAAGAQEDDGAPLPSPVAGSPVEEDEGGTGALAGAAALAAVVAGSGALLAFRRRRLGG